MNKLSIFDFPDNKVLLVSRIDGTRGPLGVAKAVCLRLAQVKKCEIEEVSSFASAVSLVAKILFWYKGYSICIHSNGLRLPMVISLIAKINTGNAYYLVVHGIAAEEQKYRPVLFRDLELEPKVIRGFPNLICVSDFELDVLQRHYGRRKNVTVIGNGVNAPEAKDVDLLLARKRSSYPPVVITTGGYEERKGCDLALLVLSEFARRTGVKPRLIVCGRDSREVGSNRILCEQIAAAGNVELDFRGEITDKNELLNLYRDADFYAGLSRFDTFNVSVLEGAASCCVPLVSEECGASGLFGKANSVKCDINDVDWQESVVSSLIELCADDERYREVARHAFEVAVSNTWDDVAERYWEVLSNGE